MPRLLLTALLFLASGCAASGPELQRDTAVPEPEASQPLVDPLAELDERLNLSESQERSIRRTLAARKDALAAARRQPDIRSRRVDAERARTEADARIIAALSPAQREIYEEIRAERPPTYDPAVARQLRLLDDRLTLTDEQTSQIGAILTRQVEEVEPLIARGRASGEGRDAIIEEINAIRDRTDAEIIEVLTEEQAVTYRRFREQQTGQRRPGRRRR